MACVKAIHLIPIGSPRSGTDTDVGPVILDDIRSVIARSDVNDDDIGIADCQSSGCEWWHRFAVRMHDIGKPVC